MSDHISEGDEKRDDSQSGPWTTDLYGMKVVIDPSMSPGVAYLTPERHDLDGKWKPQTAKLLLDDYTVTNRKVRPDAVMKYVKRVMPDITPHETDQTVERMASIDIAELELRVLAFYQEIFEQRVREVRALLQAGFQVTHCEGNQRLAVMPKEYKDAIKAAKAEIKRDQSIPGVRPRSYFFDNLSMC